MLNNDTPIKLRGKTQKAKNRVKELGEDWVVAFSQTRVMFSAEENWYLIYPISNPDKVRWIKQVNDQNFEVIQ